MPVTGGRTSGCQPFGSGLVRYACLKPRNRKQIPWPVAGIVTGVLVAILHPEASIPLTVGIAAWWVAMGLMLIFSAHPVGARIGVLMAGLFMAVPCFVAASPLACGLLMCAM